MDQLQNSSNSTHLPSGQLISVGLRGLCSVIGVLGNIMVVAVLVRHFQKEKFTLHLMLNLAVCDILSMLTLPVWILNLLLGWSMDLVLCKFFCFVTYICLYGSLLTVSLMSVQRYLLVLYRPRWDKLGRKGERLLLLFLWVVSGVLSIPAVVTYHVVGDEDGSNRKCQQVPSSEAQKVAALLSETVLGFVIPFGLTVTCYFCLNKKVQQKTVVSSQKLTKLVSLIVVTFFMCWIPYHIVNVLTIFTPLEPGLHLHRLPYDGTRRVAQGIAFINSCVNPFLYAFHYRALRLTDDRLSKRNTTKNSTNLSDRVTETDVRVI